MLTSHPLWIEIKPFIDTSGDGNTKPFLIRGKVPVALTERLKAHTEPCIRCGEEIQVYRTRANGRQPYLSLTCPLQTNIGCSRSGIAHEVYKTIREEELESTGKQGGRKVSSKATSLRTR